VDPETIKKATEVLEEVGLVVSRGGGPGPPRPSFRVPPCPASGSVGGDRASGLGAGGYGARGTEARPGYSGEGQGTGGETCAAAGSPLRAPFPGRFPSDTVP